MAERKWGNVLRRLRDGAVKMGLCSICRARTPRDGLKSCDVCIGRVSTYRIKNEARNASGFDDDGWCPECIAFGFHRSDCQYLRIKAAAEVLGLDI